jgi:hypothetical protein
VDGEVAIFVFILILLDPTVGVVVFDTIKFQSAGGETDDGIAGPEEKKREIAARGQESKSLDVVRFEKPFVFASMLSVDPEAAVPRPGAITITTALNGKRFRSFVFVGKTIGVQRGTMRGIADGGIDGNGFSNFGEEVGRDGNLQSNLPFAARFQGKLFRLLGDGSGRHVAVLGKKGGEAEDEDGLSPNHETGAVERVCGEEASEMEQIAAVVNLRRLAPVKMSN